MSVGIVNEAMSSRRSVTACSRAVSSEALGDEDMNRPRAHDISALDTETPGSPTPRAAGPSSAS